MTPLRDREPVLAALASGAERANRPTAVVIFSALLLLVVTIFALMSVRDASRARALYVWEAGNRAQVETVADQIRLVRKEEEVRKNQPDAFAPEPRLLSAISSAGSAAGLPPSLLRIEEGREEVPNSPLVRRTVTARLDGQPIEPVFEWLQGSLQAVSGLHIIQLSLKPTPRGWDLTVKFARWELKSSQSTRP